MAEIKIRVIGGILLFILFLLETIREIIVWTCIQVNTALLIFSLSTLE
jgi:hypothetical protein